QVLGEPGGADQLLRTGVGGELRVVVLRKAHNCSSSGFEHVCIDLLTVGGPLGNSPLTVQHSGQHPEQRGTAVRSYPSPYRPGERGSVSRQAIMLEQQYLDRLYQRVDELREETTSQLAEMLRAPGTDSTALLHRDAQVARLEQRTADLARAE